MKRDDTFEEIRKKKREIEKQKREEVRKVVDKFDILFKALEAECPHDYRSQLRERVFGWINVGYCFHCNSTISEEEYEKWIETRK